MPRLYVENLDADREFSLQDPTGLAGLVLRVGAGTTVPFDMSWSQLNAFEPRLKDAVAADMIRYRVENTDQTLGDDQRAAVTFIFGDYQVVATDEVIVVNTVPCTVILTNDPARGHVVKIIDASGMASALTPIVVRPAPDTGAINGGDNAVVDVARGAVECVRGDGEWLCCACSGAVSVGSPPALVQTVGDETVPLYAITIDDRSSGWLSLAVVGASATANAVFRAEVALYRNDAGPGLVVSAVAMVIPPTRTDPALELSVVLTGPGAVSVLVTGAVGAGTVNWGVTPSYRQVTAPSGD